jgi:hypothetical protein
MSFRGPVNPITNQIAVYGFLEGDMAGETRNNERENGGCC